MKFCLCLFLIFFLFPTVTFSQEKNNTLFAKATINEVELGYERFVKKNLSFSFDAGYRFSYFNEWHYYGNALPTEYAYYFLCFRGPVCRVAANFKLSGRYFIGPLIGYQYLSCDDIFIDTGGNQGYPKPNGLYQKYSEYDNEIIIQCMNQVRLGGIKSPVSFYYALGAKLCFSQRNYSINGRVENRKPSNEIVNTNYFLPSFAAGIKIKMINF